MKYKIINRKKLFATMFFDIIGGSPFFFINALKKKKEIDFKIKEILIIRTAYIGDVIMTLPILKPLKEKFPDARISFLTSKEAGELLKGNPYIDTIFHFNPFWFYHSPVKEYLNFLNRIRAKRFDLVIEARGDIRELLFIVSLLKSRFKLSYGFGGGAYLLTHVVPYKKIKHRVEYHLDMIRYLDCQTKAVDFGIYLNGNEKQRVREILELNRIKKPFIAVHPGSRLPLKRWPDQKCARLYDRIIEEYKMPLVVLGSQQEEGTVDNIVGHMKYKPAVLAGRLTLRELAGVLEETTLLICNDSAPMHMAAAMKSKTVAIFGPSKSRETGPYGSECRIVEKDFPCRFSCDESVCNHKIHNGCIQAVTVDDVFKSVQELLQ